MRSVVYKIGVLCLLALSAPAWIVINEVCYDNSSVADETGDTSSDWIELYNEGTAPHNIRDYGLGDANPFENNQGVRLPDYTLQPGEHLVVFANGELPEYTAWVNAPDLVLIPPSASWSYRSAAEPPAAGWNALAYDDAAWTTGPAPLGYNDAKQDMDCATVLDDGGNAANRYPSAYFRASFQVLSPSVMTGLVLHARIDDGVVVYLNGVEVFRQNMPSGSVSYETWALASVPSTQWTTKLLPTNGLVQGENVVAVEVHQALAASPDLIMDLTLTGLVNKKVPVVHGQFRLAREGENVHLFDDVLTRVQFFASPGFDIGENHSYGAVTDGSTTDFRVYSTPSPGMPNPSTATRFSEILPEKPVFFVAPGAYTNDQFITLRVSSPSYRIYYTLDGTDPRDSSLFVMSGGNVRLSAANTVTNGLSWQRTNPPETDNLLLAAAWRPPRDAVERVSVLRAVAVDASGKYCSEETSGSYLIGPRFQTRTLPVVSVLVNPDDLFGFAKGIYVPGKTYADSPEGYGSNKWGKPYANYFQDNAGQTWERQAHVELLEPGESGMAVAQVLGMANSGGGTRALPQKKMQFYARAAEYGSNRLDYALFPQLPLTWYKRFLLSNSGDDWYGPNSGGVATMMKDAVFHEMSLSLNVGVMASRPAVVYLNGEFWGLHNVRENGDKYYLASHYGIEPDNADVLAHQENPADATKVTISNEGGDPYADEDYLALLSWVQGNPLGSDANYRQFQTQVDVTNYTDHVIAHTFFANTDWPANNCEFWRTHTNQVAFGSNGDSRWRWLLGSMDRAGEDGFDFNMFAYLSTPEMSGKENPAFLINALWGNAAYTSFFVARYERLLNTVFSPARTAAVIQQAASVVGPEMEQHFRRWGRPFTHAQWQNAVDAVLVGFTAERHAVSWGHLSAKFALGGAGVLTVRNQRGDGVGGHFVVDGLVIEPSTPGVTSRAEWSGRFFKIRPITIQARPDAGYRFDGWEGRAETNAELSVVALDLPQEFVARFLPVETTLCVVAFDAEGGAVSPVSVERAVGGLYGELPVPMREGYVFAGWWTAAGGNGGLVTADTPVIQSEAHTLYAKWNLSSPAESSATAGVFFSQELPEAFEDAARVTVKGLPPGLRYNAATRLVEGVPTKPGVFSVVIAAPGVVSQTVPITVEALPLWAQGAFSGYVTNDMGGVATMSVTALGRVSGKIQFNATTYSFSAASYSAMEADGAYLIEAAAKSGRTVLPVSVRVWPVRVEIEGAVPVTVGNGAGALGGPDGIGMVMYRDSWKEEGMPDLLSTYVGYYTATLPGNSEYGSGYLTFTVNSTAKVKTLGKLADGTSVSMGGSLIVDESGQVWTVLYAAPSSYKGGVFFGLAEFAKRDGKANDLRCLWERPVLWSSSSLQATEVYGAGFARGLWLDGGWYSKTDNLYTYYVDKDLAVGTDTNAPAPVLTVGTNRYESIWWNPAGVALTPVLNGSGVMTGLAAPKAGTPVDPEKDGVWDYSAENTVGLKVALTVATGVFKGSFKAWFDYPVKKHTSRTVSFEGVVTPEREDRADGIEGRGYFLWPDKAPVPSTATTYPFKWSYDFLLLGE